MKDTMDVRWETEDGYVGKSRPQCFNINIEDMAEECETEEEALLYLEQETQRDFESSVSFSIKNSDQVIEAWAAFRAATSGGRS